MRRPRGPLTRPWWSAMLPALAVLLPAVALGYLGLRAYKAEQVLAASRFQRSLDTIASLMAAGLENAAASSLRELADLARARLPTDVDVERVRSRHPLIGQVFLLDRRGDFLYPTLSRHRPRAARPPPEVEPPRGTRPAHLYQLVAAYHRRLKREMEAKRLLETAHTAELEGHRDRAYRAFAAVASRSVRLSPQAQLGMARTAQARKDYHRAARRFSVLIHRYRDQRDWAGVSYQLLGRVGLVVVAQRCERRPADPGSPGACPKWLADAHTEAFRLYADLVHDRIPTTPASRFHYILWSRRHLGTPGGADARRRLAELDASVSLLRVGLRFAAELGRRGGRNLVRQAGYSPRALRHPGFRQGRALLIVQALGDRGVVGYVLKRRELERAVVRQQARQKLPEGFSVRLLRQDESSPKHRPTLVRPLGEVLGDLRLAFFGPRPASGLLGTSAAVQYLALTGGLVLVLLAGLITIYRGVRQEMALARLRSDFVSNVSHELKTPLTSIRMFGEMLQQGLAVEAAQQRKYYNIIVAESERLGRLIGNVLDFSRIERGTKTYTFETHSLAELGREAVETFRHFREAEGFEISLRVLAQPDVRADRDAVIQSLINLLTNAVKYSGESRRVEVRVNAGPETGIVSVIDHGIGIPRAEQKRVFDEFYRASNVGRGGAEGTGLGLALVRRHCEHMRGAVEVESTPGQGSTFRMILPRVAGEPLA